MSVTLGDLIDLQLHDLSFHDLFPLFSSNLCELKRCSGKTWLQLSVLLGVSKSTLDGLAYCYNTPSLLTILKIAAYFNVSLDNLLFDDIRMVVPHVSKHLWRD